MTSTKSLCDRIYEGLLNDREVIGEAVGEHLKWDLNDKFQWASIWHKFGEGMLTEHRTEVQDWLGKLLNHFINELRPRIEALLREE